MIGTLKGKIEYREDPYLIIDINGVGYRVLVPLSVLSKINGTGDNIKLYTHTHVREDILELYGFTEPQDLKLFQYLISVSGIGCKTALAVYSVGSRQEIIKAITTNDTTFFTGVPRLGKKNAQKIIIELKNKLGGVGDIDLSADSQESDEVITALKTFGFTAQESRIALKSLNGAEGQTVSDKIRLALKYLGK
jgi:Holliday junction DNA helicase RuvA